MEVTAETLPEKNVMILWQHVHGMAYEKEHPGKPESHPVIPSRSCINFTNKFHAHVDCNSDSVNIFQLTSVR